MSKDLFWLLVVDWLSTSYSCSTDSVGTPADCGVLYRWGTFQTVWMTTLASLTSETQPQGIVDGGVELALC